MKLSSTLSYSIVIVIAVLVFGQQVAWAYQPAPRVDNNNPKYSQNYNKLLEKNKKSYYGQESDYLNNNNNYNNNESSSFSSADIDQQRIQISEPYKTLIQTSVRLAITQSGASKHVDVDMAMDLINDTSYMLSKPSTLNKFFKTITVILATLITSAFLFPGAYKFADVAWREPNQAFKMFEANGRRYLPNGINEKTIINLLGQVGAGEFISSVGFTDANCREQSVCQLGELVKCTFPQTSDFLIHFVELHFSRPRYRENKYVNAFLLGFVEQNCAALINSITPSDNERRAAGKNCFGNLFGSYLLSKCPNRQRDSSMSVSQDTMMPPPPPPTSNNKQKVEFQTIQAGRA